MIFLSFVQVKILRKELREREKKAIVSILSRAEVGNRNKPLLVKVLTLMPGGSIYTDGCHASWTPEAPT